MIATIQRLPVEILAAVFSFYCPRCKDVPLILLWVCGLWRDVALAMPHIWSNVRLCTYTNVEKIAFILDRTANGPLYVKIATDADLFTSVAHKSPRYAGLLHAATQGKRWRSLTIMSSPQFNYDPILNILPSAFNGPLEGLQSFKIEDYFENCISLLPLITFPHDKITDMKLSSFNALNYFMQPQFTTIFRALIIFKVWGSGDSTAVDILTQFQQLEVLDACDLCLPTYAVETDLKLVDTLKSLRINYTSIQWMVDRMFPNLEECEITQPLHCEMFVPGCSVNLPVCTKFTYDKDAIDIIPNFCTPKLAILIIQKRVPRAWASPVRRDSWLEACDEGQANHEDDDRIE